MDMSRRHPWFRIWSAVMLVCLGLSGCLSFPQFGAAPAATQTPAAVQPAGPDQPENTPVPSATSTQPQIRTSTPADTPTPVMTATPSGIPDLLADFPLFAGAQVDPSGAYAEENSAGLLIWTSMDPGELDAFYQDELEKVGWTLRYSESNAVGGFLQEWRKDKAWLSVEYHFLEMKPAVQADLRIIESKEALVVLLGFPLPNGTVVTNTDGPSIELYVPQEYTSAWQYFLTTMYKKGWVVKDIKLDPRCGSRACQELLEDDYSHALSLEPTPTPDIREPHTYLVTLKNRTQYKMTFLPHRDGTIVFVDANWTYSYRSWIPVPPYPNGELQAVKPYVMMFTTSDSLETVKKHYQDGLVALGWKADPNAIFIEKEYEYHNTWLKRGQALSITLSRGKGTTYGTITCRGCWQQ